MFCALVLVALHAAPIDVVVVTAPEPAGAALKKALAGRTVVDGSALYAYLFASGPVPMQDFDAFRAAPVAGWPTSLAAAWADGLAHCRGIAGPPPWKDTLPAVHACATRLSRFLWEQYLGQVRADRVVELTGTLDRTAGAGRLSALVYAPGAEATRTVASAWLAGKTAPPSGPAAGDVAKRWAALVDGVVKAALAGEGATGRREVVKHFVEETGLNPLAGEAPVTGAVTLKTSCDALPKVLRVTPGGAVADSVAARWAASTSGTGAARDCALTLTTHDEAVLGAPVRVVSALLACGDVTSSAEVASAGARRSPVDVLSERLVVSLAARWCSR